MNDVIDDAESKNCESNNDESHVLPVLRATEVFENNDMEIQYAVPYHSDRRLIEKKLLLCINKLTLILCILNLPYIFKSFSFYLLRVGFMIFCQYYGVLKENTCILNSYILETIFSLFIVRPILIIMWCHYNSFFILSFECFQIPFESILMVKLNIVRKKRIMQNSIPLANHECNDIPLAFDVVEA